MDRSLYKRRIDQNLLRADDYLASLLEAAYDASLITEYTVNKVKTDCMELLASRAALFTEGKSSSVPVETAQLLLDSVTHTIGVYLKSLSSPEDAASYLENGNYSVFRSFCLGLRMIENSYKAAKKRYIRLKKHIIKKHIIKYNKINEFLNEFVAKLNNNTTFKTEIKDKCIYVFIDGENVGNLIGYRGEALYALENILKAIANKNTENRVIVRLDIANYKEKRIKTLQEVAGKKARIVEVTGKTITLEPMQAYERKIIHSYLQENPKVETRSIGLEPHRRIVITKK